MENEKEKCPKCGSEDITYQAIPKIVKNGKSIFWWVFIGWWRWIVELLLWLFAIIPTLIVILFSHKKTKTFTESVAVCQNCQHSWIVKQGNKKVIKIAKISVTVFFGMILVLIIILNTFPPSLNAVESNTDLNALYTQYAQTIFVSLTLTANSDPNAIYTQVAGTVIAEITQNAEVPTPTVSQTQMPIPVTGNSALVSYAKTKYSQITECSQILDTLTYDFTYISENIDAITDETVMRNIYTDLDQMKFSCTNFYEESAPQEVASANEYLKMVDQEYLAFYDEAVYGFQNYDTDSINSANIHIANASNYFKLATEEINKVYGAE